VLLRGSLLIDLLSDKDLLELEDSELKGYSQKDLKLKRALPSSFSVI